MLYYIPLIWICRGFFHIFQDINKIQIGTVNTENKWDRVASFAPDEQSSPMSFGNTMEFNPQGIQAMRVAGIIIESSESNLQAENTKRGRPKRRIATRI